MIVDKIRLIGKQISPLFSTDRTATRGSGAEAGAVHEGCESELVRLMGQQARLEHLLKVAKTSEPKDTRTVQPGTKVRLRITELPPTGSRQRKRITEECIIIAGDSCLGSEHSPLIRCHALAWVAHLLGETCGAAISTSRGTQDIDITILSIEMAPTTLAQLRGSEKKAVVPNKALPHKMAMKAVKRKAPAHANA